MTKENFNKRIILWKLVRHYWSDNSKFIGLRRFTFCRNISIWLFLASSTFLFLHRNDQKLCKIYFNWIRNLTKDIYSKIRYVQFKGFLLHPLLVLFWHVLIFTMCIMNIIFLYTSRTARQFLTPLLFMTVCHIMAMSTHSEIRLYRQTWVSITLVGLVSVFWPAGPEFKTYRDVCFVFLLEVDFLFQFFIY